MKKFYSYIKEQNDQKDVDDIFNIGDEVIVNGVVDEEEFNNLKGTISDKGYHTIWTDRNEKGECDYYRYNKRMTYYISEVDWWVSPYNLTKQEEHKRVFNDLDPHGEERWES